MQEQEPKGLLTPQVMPEPDLEASGIQLDDGDAADIAHEALMPPENPFSNLTTQSET